MLGRPAARRMSDRGHELSVTRHLGALMVLILVATGCGGGPPQAADRLVAIGAGLQGPPGLTATEYTRGLAKASAFAFDPAGRLWVATADSTDHSNDGVYVVPRSGAAPLRVI